MTIHTYKRDQFLNNSETLKEATRTSLAFWCLMLLGKTEMPQEGEDVLPAKLGICELE